MGRQNSPLASKELMYEYKRLYNDLNVYCRELAPGTVSLTGDRAQGDDSEQCAYSSPKIEVWYNFNII